MRTTEEIQKLAKLLDWYKNSGRIRRQNRDTQMNISGVIAAIDWLNGEDNVVAGTIADIQEMQRIDDPQRN